MRWEKWQMNYWMPEAKKARLSDSKVKHIQRQRIKKRDAVVEKLRFWNTMADAADPKHKQAKHMIEKFGGIIPFSIASGMHPENIINNWLAHPMPGFDHVNEKRKYYITHGLIPPRYLTRLLVVSRYWGILIKPEDLYPDFIGENGVHNFHNNAEIMEWIKRVGTGKDMKQFEHIVASLVSTD